MSSCSRRRLAASRACQAYRGCRQAWDRLARLASLAQVASRPAWADCRVSRPHPSPADFCRWPATPVFLQCPLQVQTPIHIQILDANSNKRETLSTLHENPSKSLTSFLTQSCCNDATSRNFVQKSKYTKRLFKSVDISAIQIDF